MKSVFITGAAQGIGLTTAKLFSQKGYFVGLYDINIDGVNEQLTTSDFAHACAGFCDVTDSSSIESALAEFSQHTGGKIDVLINNAGVLSSGSFAELPQQKHDLMIDINIKGFTNVAKLAHPYLKQTANSTMINLCSASSIYGIPLLAVYSATKFYVNALSQALSIEWAKDDIRVIAIKPPVLNNSMGKTVDSKITEKMSVDLSSDDVAEAIYHSLVGNKISYILGFKTKVWAFIDRLLPQMARHRLIKYLTNM